MTERRRIVIALCVLVLVFVVACAVGCAAHARRCEVVCDRFAGSEQWDQCVRACTVTE